MSSKYDGQFAPGYQFPGTEWTVVDGVVIRPAQGGDPMLDVRCRCGYIRSHRIIGLKRRSMRSCKRCSRVIQAQPNTGDVFGKLTVIDNSPIMKWVGIKNPHEISYYLCRCQCGRISEKRVNGLRTGHAVSCGHCKTVGNISGTYWSAVKWGAKARNLEFTITQPMVLAKLDSQHNNCALSGVAIEFSKNTSKDATTYKEQTASIDRIDSTKGYLEDNIQIVHKHINYVKMDMSDGELIEWARKIVKNAGKKKRTKRNGV